MTCAADGCEHSFFYVPERLERAPYCFDHADELFGTRREDWSAGYLRYA